METAERILKLLSLREKMSVVPSQLCLKFGVQVQTKWEGCEKEKYKSTKKDVKDEIIYLSIYLSIYLVEQNK